MKALQNSLEIYILFFSRTCVRLAWLWFMGESAEVLKGMFEKT